MKTRKQRRTRGKALAFLAVIVLTTFGLRCIAAQNDTSVGESSTTEPEIRSIAEAPPDVLRVALDSPPLRDWNPEEYEQLAAASEESTDVLGHLRTSAVPVPTTRMSLEEFLAANPADELLFYEPPKTGATEDKTRQKGQRPTGGGLFAGTRDQIQIEASEYLDYDEEHHFIYGHGRISARFGTNKVEADRMLVDTRLREVQAYGNVIITGPQQYVTAKSLWVNTRTGEAVAYNTRGRYSGFYFLGDPYCGDGTTTFRQVSRDESVLKDASFTTCDFPVPHFRLQAKEFTVYQNDRVFASNVVLYVHQVPVLWMPYYTKSLKEKSPWGFMVGDDSKLGGFVRVWYDYYHSCYEPSIADEDTMVKATAGHAKLVSDYMSKRGWGKGLDYKYYINHGQHQGELQAYQINDTERDISDDSNDRTYLNWFHRTRIGSDLQWLVDVDYPSDPDIHYDIFDRLNEWGDPNRYRVAERHVRTAFEWTRDDFFAGLMVELKDRVGRNRITNFADPLDDDADFETIGDEEGISSKRFGRVTERLPQLTVSSNRLRLYCLPLWYHLDLNVFNSLDKGLNVVGDDDDAMVRGFDLYQSISHLLKFDDRYTLLTKFGFGVGTAERDKWTYDYDFPAGTVFPFVPDPHIVSGKDVGLVFVGPETFMLGTKKMSLRDVEPEFAYGDIDSRFNARLTESLNAWLRYRYREGTDDSLGEFYEAVGSRKTRDDLYAFRTPQHWIESGLTWNFEHPKLTFGVSGGKNLQGEEDITPNEPLEYVSSSVGWSNTDNTVLLNTGLSLQKHQMRDPTDPYQYEQDSLVGHVGASYNPIHRRYWSRVGAYLINNQNEDPIAGSQDDKDYRNLDAQDNTMLDWVFGRRLGSKYLVELRARTDTRNVDSGDTYVRIERDFHDLVAGLSFEHRGERTNDDYYDDQDKDEGYQVRFQFKFKRATDKGVLPVTRNTNLFSGRKTGAFETGG